MLTGKSERLLELFARGAAYNIISVRLFEKYFKYWKLLKFTDEFHISVILMNKEKCLRINLWPFSYNIFNLLFCANLIF